MSLLQLPNPPTTERLPVKAWREPLVIPTYFPAAPERYPMFLEKRVYQGSSGKVYPLPVIDRISEQKHDHPWDAIHLENEFIRLTILPALGGRIHIGLDKTNGYDFFYRQNVIKPALVGLAGPWISGGVEFNWPQHHRPSTFTAVDTEIERHRDGSVTVWCSEHEPMNRMKGMHGVCLRPGSSVVEVKARVYNRTELTQTFLWWANVATRVHERYQSFFPGDVRYVADHAKRAMSAFPLCSDRYYGVDYAAAAARSALRTDKWQDGTTIQFPPPANAYAANDLSWYANIPVPTSYMAMGSREDFFGGYDHAYRAAGAGVVHLADRRIAPGKKQWTWGNHNFGYAWDRQLTDSDGPYIELMAGVYTDNQPDFSYLAPGETKSWSQYWYPIQSIGPASKANLDAAVSLTTSNNRARIGVAATRRATVRITLHAAGKEIWSAEDDLSPAHPFTTEMLLPAGATDSPLELRVFEGGRELISYAPLASAQTDIPPAAQEPPLPADVATVEDLYLIGVHLEQYRHATRMPEDYWREALRRAPDDARCNTALAWRCYHRGEFTQAHSHFSRALKTLTAWNPNPRDGEASYGLGLALLRLNRPEEAYDALYKSTWNNAFQSPAFYAVAQLDCKKKDWPRAKDHLRRALAVNHDHLQARNLLAIVVRKLNDPDAATELLAETLRLDPLDSLARRLTPSAPPPFTAGLHTAIDLAWELAQAGLDTDALALLQDAQQSIHPAVSNLLGTVGSDRDLGAPVLAACLDAFLRHRLGDATGSSAALARARELPLDYTFPARLDEAALLHWAIAQHPSSPRAPYLLGNWLYDRRRHREAITLWEQAAAKIPADPAAIPIIWRNLGIAYFNILHDPARAKDAYDRALAADPSSARLLYERDQLWKRTGVSSADRLAELEKFPALVTQRDDLSVELATLYNNRHQPQAALDLLQSRHFQPWEGGEGLALDQYVTAHLALARNHLDNRDPAAAIRHLQSALDEPRNLGEARHLLANQADIHFFLGNAFAAVNDPAAARREWEIAAATIGDFQSMSVRPCSDLSCYAALAMKALGREDEATRLLNAMLAFAETLLATPAKIDYFATSLPTMLLFDDDLQQRQNNDALTIKGLALHALGRKDEAARTLGPIMHLLQGRSAF